MTEVPDEAAEAHHSPRLSALLRRISWNSGFLLVSGGLSGLLGLATLAVLARALTPRDLGVFVLLSGYATLVSRLAGFQSWQPVISYAGRDGLKSSAKIVALLSCALTLDIVGAIFAGAVTLGAAPMAFTFMKITAGTGVLLALAGTSVSAVAGLPTAALRLANKHNLYSIHMIVTSAVRFAIVAGTAVLTRDMQYSVYAWAASQVITNLSLLALGYWVLGKHGIGLVPPTFTRKAFRRFPGIIHAFMATNFIQTAKILRDGDVLLVGGMFSAEAAAMFRIAKQVGDVIIKATDPLVVAVFPEFARLQGQRLSARLLAATSGLMLVAGAIATAAFLTVGPTIVQTAFGSTYEHLFPVALLCVIAASIRAVGQPGTSALLANRRSMPVLLIVVVTGLAYIGLLLFLAKLSGSPTSPALALMVGNTLMTVGIVARAWTESRPQSAVAKASPAQ